jgi:hypothetical protein
MDMGILAELIDQEVSVGVVSNHAQSIEFETAVEYGKVESHIERASTPTHRFCGDVGERTLGGVMVDNLDQIEDPVSAAGNTLPLLS